MTGACLFAWRLCCTTSASPALGRSTPTVRLTSTVTLSWGRRWLAIDWSNFADSLATAGAEALLPRWPGYAAHVARIVSWQPRVRTKTGVMLDGHAIMDVTGLTPGPLVGEIRAKIDEAAAIGEIVGVDDAREMAIRLAREARETRAATTA